MTSEDRHFSVKLASGKEELLAAQRLRYRVFVTELGATGPTVDHENQVERDDFDGFYDHLLLIDRRRDPASLNHVVGVYRLLRRAVAEAGPGFYSSGEYDLAPLLAQNRNLLELGRSCVDAEIRGGVAMMLMWNALADYVLRHRIDVMFGVASYHGTDLAAIAQSLSWLNQNHLAPPANRVRVRAPHYQSTDLVPAAEIDVAAAKAQTPGLIKAYLRLGGAIGDGAFVDHAFNTTDVCLVMDTALMSKRHKDAYVRKADVRG